MAVGMVLAEAVARVLLRIVVMLVLVLMVVVEMLVVGVITVLKIKAKKINRCTPALVALLVLVLGLLKIRRSNPSAIVTHLGGSLIRAGAL